MIIDETMDLSTIKQLAVTYFKMQTFAPKYFLLDLVEIMDGMANIIYLAVKQVFSELHIPMQYIIGYSSDTTNVMFGEHNSVFQMLRAVYPNFYSVKCSCHLIHLASSYAAKMLPKHLEDLCRNIFNINHFHRSSKRQDAYRDFQEFFNVEPRQLLSPGQTRWLSLEACVNRILEQYLALQHYFVLTANEDPTHLNDRIVKSLHNKFTLAYLEFLSYQLQRFNVFNCLYQSERPLLQNLKDEVEGLLKSIASDFMVVQYIKETNPKDINPTNVLHHVPQNQTYIGIAATATIHKIEEGATNEDLDRFRSDCKNFLIEIILQIKQRVDLDAEIHDIVQCISPTKAAFRTPSSLAQII
ncbi:Hypothetical predicted protein [Paramuricea clavata]|uniref:Uncharacterized protein n=1 Tax=Paramuricea clavata TaxID=317549 RepID=A0A6S7FLT0_PARCT|nr:Hypothetical predicted protein [Paramuricea clavata]